MTFCPVIVDGRPTKLDLIQHFAHVPEAAISDLAKQRWSSTTIDDDMHSVGHDSFNARLLAKLLRASVTEDFHSTLINKVPQPYHCDGTYLLWAIGNHVHRNNVAFIEHVREQIITTTLADHNNDVPKYLLSIKHKLRMMTSPTKSDSQSSHGLLVYILRQLKLMQNVAFQEYIRTLHIQFQEGKLSDKTPYNLIVDIEDRIRILQHAGEWDTPAASDINPMALLSAPTSDVSNSMKAYVDQQLRHYLKTLLPSRGYLAPGADGKVPSTRLRPQGRFHKEWMFIPPKTPNQQLVYNGSTFFWCTKCNNGAGQWVTSHQTATHVDGFRHPRARVPAQHGTYGQPQPTSCLPQRPGYPDSSNPPIFQRAPRPSFIHTPRPVANVAQEPSTMPQPSSMQVPDDLVTPEQLCLAAGIENCFDLLNYDVP